MKKRRLLRNKKTGEIGELLGTERAAGLIVIDVDFHDGNPRAFDYTSLEQLNEEWEDYEPKEPLFKDEKIRRGIRAWWDMQDNPFKAAAVLCHDKKDLDGFYHWRIFGYIREGEQKESTDLCFRTKKLYDYNPSHDYTKEELCGEEEE